MVSVCTSVLVSSNGCVCAAFIIVSLLVAISIETEFVNGSYDKLCATEDHSFANSVSSSVLLNIAVRNFSVDISNSGKLFCGTVIGFTVEFSC